MEQAVLFVDITGSTKLYETSGDDAAKRLVDGCLAVLRTVTAEYGGRVVKTIGDELMCVFPAVDPVAKAACEMQSRIADDDSAALHGLSIRIGFHAGRLIEENGDVFGDAVNTAARVTDLAKAGQIVTTEATSQRLSVELRDSTRSMGSFPVKGKADSVALCEVIWQVDNLTVISGSLPNADAAMTLRLDCVDGVFTLRPGDEAITIGRASSCGIRLQVRCASRLHARIEFRRDKFVLTDSSTNGTFIQADGDDEVVLNREEFILRGRGRISLGHSNCDGECDLRWSVSS